MVGLGQVGQFEIKGKRARQLIQLLDRQPADAEHCFLHALLGRVHFAGGLLLTPTDGIAAQLFHLGEKRVTGLLAQHRAQQHAQRAHIAPQGRFFFIGGIGEQLA